MARKRFWKTTKEYIRSKSLFEDVSKRFSLGVDYSFNNMNITFYDAYGHRYFQKLDFKSAYSVGPFLSYNLSKNFDISLGCNLSWKKFKIDYGYTVDDYIIEDQSKIPVKTDFTTYYLDLNLNLKYS